jgi:nucleoside-diphosphate-sugar epimerase
VVTGAAGLIGSRLIQELNPDWFIYGISRSKLSKDLDPKRVQQISVDLSKEWDICLLPDKTDVVIHLAQSEHFREFPERATDIFQVNTLSTLRFLDYAYRVGAQTFVLASSGGIYGYGNQEFSEEAEISSKGNLGFYLGTKLCSEVLAENYRSFMNVIVLRFFFVYGPGQKQNMLIPRLVQSVLGGKPITLQGQDGIRINPTYVSDAVAAIIRSLNLKGSHKINIGGPEVLSLREIGETIGKVVAKEPKFYVQPNIEPRHLVGDIHKMSTLLGDPLVRFEEGLHRYFTNICLR